MVIGGLLLRIVSIILIPLNSNYPNAGFWSHEYLIDTIHEDTVNQYIQVDKPNSRTENDKSLAINFSEFQHIIENYGDLEIITNGLEVWLSDEGENTYIRWQSALQAFSDNQLTNQSLVIRSGSEFKIKTDTEDLNIERTNSDSGYTNYYYSTSKDNRLIAFVTVVDAPTLWYFISIVDLSTGEIITLPITDIYFSDQYIIGILAGSDADFSKLFIFQISESGLAVIEQRTLRFAIEMSRVVDNKLHFKIFDMPDYLFQ
jgi:hypothetical protein